MDEVKIGGIEERNQVQAAISAKNATTLSAVLVMDRDQRESEREMEWTHMSAVK